MLTAQVLIRLQKLSNAKSVQCFDGWSLCNIRDFKQPKVCVPVQIKLTKWKLDGGPLAKQPKACVPV